MNVSKTGIVVAVMVCLSTISRAQVIAPAADVRVLVALRSLKCSFPWYASADWDEDQPKVRSAPQKDFEFNIDGINYEKRSARLIGNAGAEDMTATRGDSSVSFVERVPVGTLNLTTVYAWRNKAGHYKAVHSRHTAIGGPSPSQNYGSCQPW